MMDVFFVTGNAKKFREAAALFPGLQQLSMELPEIQSLDLREIITAKLEEARRHHPGIIVVDDVSCRLACLHGLPGPLIKWFITSIGITGLVEITKKYHDDRADIDCAIGVAIPGQDIQVFIGSMQGRIVSSPDEGYGFDPIFIPNGSTKTLGDMTLEEKNAVSHRAQAWKLAKVYLDHANGN